MLLYFRVRGLPCFHRKRRIPQSPSPRMHPSVIGATTAEKLEGISIGVDSAYGSPSFSSSIHSPSTLTVPALYSFNHSLSCLFSPARFGGSAPSKNDNSRKSRMGSNTLGPHDLRSRRDASHISPGGLHLWLLCDWQPGAKSAIPGP